MRLVSNIFIVLMLLRSRHPILFCSPHGTMAIYLRRQCLIEITPDRTIRFLHEGHMAVATNSSGNANGLIHPAARILQQDARIMCLFGQQKLAVFGTKVS